jgi:hypothetical protein
MESATSAPPFRAIPLGLIVACAFAFHGPLLMMQYPSNSFDAHFHMSMAQHYAQHWFDPWNEKALGGFSQTTYPPLLHQWIAIFSHVVGLSYGFMLVMGSMLILLPVAVYRFAKLWVCERAASYGAFCSIFLGSLAIIAYESGQIGTVAATTLFLLAIPTAYQYVLTGAKKDMILGLALCCTAAGAHHATLLFGIPFFILPTIWLALREYREGHPESSVAVPVKRILAFSTLASVGIVVELLPYFMTLLKSPIEQIPIPHMSRANFILQPHWGLHYWVMPVGLVILALPYILYKGVQDRRLRPLLAGFYAALIFGLGGTTPVPKLILRRAFEILTLERFTFWAVLLAMPFVGLLVMYLIDRFGKRAAAAIAIAVIVHGSFSVAWNVYFPLLGTPIDVDPVVKFLNENGHDRYRYLTLGFANALSKIACYTNAPSIDGEYNSGRTLPEMTVHGAAQFSTSKFYGSEGMLALEGMLRQATRYGVRYIFVADRFYDPLLTFSGWRQIESFNHDTITVWVNPSIPDAKPIPSPLRPPLWQGIMWGTVPIGISLLTMVIALLQVRKARHTDIGAPGPAAEIDAEPPMEAEPVPSSVMPSSSS